MWEFPIKNTQEPPSSNGRYVKFIQNGLDARRRVIKIKFEWRRTKASAHSILFTTVRKPRRRKHGGNFRYPPVFVNGMDHWPLSASAGGARNRSQCAWKQIHRCNGVSTCCCCCGCLVSQCAFPSNGDGIVIREEDESIRLSKPLVLPCIVDGTRREHRIYWLPLILFRSHRAHTLTIASKMGNPVNRCEGDVCAKRALASLMVRWVEWRWMSSDTTTNAINQAPSIRRW